MKYLIPFLLIPVLAFGQTTIQPLTQSNIESAITDDAGFRTAIGAPATDDVATAAQGITADSALQPSDIASGTITPKTGDLDFNDFGGTVDNAAVNTAIATDTEATLETLGLTSPVEFGHRINVQPHTLTRISTYGSGGGGSGSAPIRIMTWGDSFSSGLVPPDNASISGRFDLLPSSITGTVTSNIDDGTHWISRVSHSFSTGSTAILSPGGVVGAWTRGDKAAIGFVKNSSGNTFDLQYESSLSPGVWTTVTGGDNISANNATEVGAYLVFSLPTTNAPFFRLRMNDITGPIKLITAGVYCSDGGGVIWMPQTAAVGLSPSEISIANAVLSPIWSGMAPDVMITSWLESGGTEWETGGGFRAIYDQTKAIYAATDWIMVGPHYCDPGSNSVASIDAQANAMRDFALEKNESFFDSRPMFRTYAESVALGLMALDGPGGTPGGQHLSAAGKALRNIHLWQTVPLGRFPLGVTANNTDFNSPLAGMGSEPATVGNKSYTIPRDLVVRGTNGVAIFDMVSNPFDYLKAGRIRATPSSDPNGLPEIQFGQGGSWPLRVSSQILKTTGGFALATPVNYTATGNLFRGSPVATGDATSGSITINLGHSAADTPGRIHIIKKTDSSGNTVTVDPSGSETIDGATTYVLSTQYQTVIIQSTGSNWLILSKF